MSPKRTFNVTFRLTSPSPFVWRHRHLYELTTTTVVSGRLLTSLLLTRSSVRWYRLWSKKQICKNPDAEQETGVRFDSTLKRPATRPCKDRITRLAKTTLCNCCLLQRPSNNFRLVYRHRVAYFFSAALYDLDSWSTPVRRMVPTCVFHNVPISIMRHNLALLFLCSISYRSLSQT